MTEQEKAPDLAGIEGLKEKSKQFTTENSRLHGNLSIRGESPYGALPGEWQAWAKVSAPDLLPVVSDPDAKISEYSKVKEPCKTPSDYNRNGEMRGFSDWTSHLASSKDIAKWESDNRLGICLQTRRFRAIDVDVTDFEESLDIEAFLLDRLGADVPIRRRSNSCKFLILVDLPGDYTKRRFEAGKTPKDAIEFLATKQQCIVTGTHNSRVRYQWERNGEPWTPSVDDIPKITADDFELLWKNLNERFGSGESVTVRAGLTPTKKRQLADINDPLVDFLDDRGWIKDIDRTGRVDITCPFESEHTSDSGDSATSYFPAGVGGIDRGHFDCKHSHCAHRTTEEFKREIGYDLAGFEVLPDLTPEEEAEQSAIRARNQLKAERLTLAAIERAKFKDPTALEKARREYQKDENERIGQGDETIPAAEVVSLEAALNRFVFLADGSRVADVFNPHYDLAVDDWRRTYAASKEVFPQAGDKPDKEIQVSRLWIESPRRKSVVCRTFKAGGAMVINDPQGRRALNSWKHYDRTTEVIDLEAAGVGLFLEHVDYLFGEDAGRFLDWLAHIEQHPGVLPHTAWLHISKSFGTGRNWLASVLTRIWAGNVAANFDLVKTLSSGFNDRLSRKVLAIVDEIREGGRDSQWEHSEKLKSLITEEHRTVNPKFGRISVEYNACRFLMFSNHVSAIPMEEGDRRVEVVSNEFAPRPADYYTRLYQAISDQRFIAGVAAFLARRDLSNFNPGAHAVVTAAKRRATEASKTPMVKQCELLLKYWPSDLITPADLMSVLDYVPRDLAIRAKVTSNHRRTLEQFGIRRKAESLKVHGVTVKIWFIRNADYWETANSHALVTEYLKGLNSDRSIDGCTFLDDLAAV